MSTASKERSKALGALTPSAKRKCGLLAGLVPGSVGANFAAAVWQPEVVVLSGFACAQYIYR
eukprot:700535-Rhodomonas_salina.1